MVQNGKRSKGSALRAALRELLTQEVFTSQENLRVALIALGFNINQAAISRVLHKLGAVKIPENGQLVYRIPISTAQAMSRRGMEGLIKEVKENGYLIVVHTASGSAQLVAHVLDHNKEFSVLGTVAGDDTIFIAPSNISDIPEIVEKIRQYIL